MGSAQKIFTTIKQFSVIRKIALVAFAGSVIVMVLEPSHTENLPILAAYALWVTHLFLIGMIVFVGFIMCSRMRVSQILSWLISIVVAPILFAPISMILDFGFGNPDQELFTQATAWQLYLGEVLAITPLVLMTGIVIAALTLAIRPVASPEKDDMREAPALGALFKSVPKSLGENLIRLQAQDHYVELVTDQGKILLSERFRDCVKRVGSLNGFQCHRSHWVNVANIDKVERDGKSWFCNMTNGDRVPVSRRKLDQLREHLPL